SPIEIVFQYGVNCSYAILPVDLFAFGIGSAAVGNAHFVDPASCAGEFGNDLRLNTEPIFFYLNRFNEGSSKRLVAGLNVRQIKIGEHVGEQGQKFVANHVPEKKDTMRSPAHEPRAEDCIRFV